MKHIEREVQAACIDFYDRFVEPKRPRRSFIFAVPNGEPRNPVIASILKGQGVRAGVWDLVLLLEGARVVWIEVKRPDEQSYRPGVGYRVRKGGELSASQKEFETALNDLGFTHRRVVRSVIEFQAVLTEFGLLYRNKAA